MIRVCRAGITLPVSLLVVLLIAGVSLADRPVTREADLSALAARFRAELQASQNAEYHRLMAITDGYWGALHADPSRQLMGVDKDGQPIIYYTTNADAAHSTRVDELHPGGASGYERDGSELWGVAVWDNGVADVTHQDFIGHIMIGDDGEILAAHANHTCGTVAGAGFNPSAKGMAYGALLSSFDWGGDRPEMAANASWIHISSHSYHYGGNTYGTYEGSSADFDEIMYLAPYYLGVFAAANDGPGFGTIYPSSCAKNQLVVGATHDVDNYTGPNSVSIAGFSSRGPTADGRIKPDVVGNGVNLYSTQPGNNYTYMSGTSMATPNVAGTAFVVLEHWYLTHDYLPPLSSTLKAILIHTADECGIATGPDYTYGWGLVNAWAAADLITADVTAPGVIDEHELTNGGQYEETIEVSGDQPLRVTLAWIDPPATPGANPALVHDLDLQVVRVSDGQHFLAYVMNPNDPNEPAGTGDNDVDNVEMVFVADPEPGQYRIEVDHEGALTEDSQWFSLIVTGTSADDPLMLSLNPGETELGDQGGVLDFAITLVNSSDQAYPSQTFWTSAQLPNGNEYGPLFTSQSFTLQSGADILVPSMTQNIPAFAPTGTYQLIGRVGEWPDVMLTDAFEFTKGLQTAVGDDFANDWSSDGWVDRHTQLAQTGEAAGQTRVEAWPNPFNASTQLTIHLMRPGQVEVRVVDVLGREVARLIDSPLAAGPVRVAFGGREYPSGVYFVHVSLDGAPVASQKVLMLK